MRLFTWISEQDWTFEFLCSLELQVPRSLYYISTELIRYQYIDPFWAQVLTDRIPIPKAYILSKFTNQIQWRSDETQLINFEIS